MSNNWSLTATISANMGDLSGSLPLSNLKSGQTFDDGSSGGITNDRWLGAGNASTGSPVYIEFDFGSAKDVRGGVVYQWLAGGTSEPSDSATASGQFTGQFQYYNGSTWSDVGTAFTNETLAKAIRGFTLISTNKMRLKITDYLLGGSPFYVAMQEIQFWDFLPDAIAPGDVVLTGATVISQSEINVAFNTPLTDNIAVTKLKVQRCESNSFSGGTLVEYETTTLTSPFVDNSGLSPSVATTYYYRAKAYDGTNYSANWSNTVSARIIPPLVAEYTYATSINFGTTLSLTDATTGGDGTKTRVWEIDGFSATPANGNYVNPTFTVLSAGDHSVKLTVTDDSGSEDVTHSIFVGTLTGALFVPNSTAQTYTTNVPTTITWSVLSGSGSINGSGQYTAPSSGSGSSVLKALNSARFATKTIYYGAALVAHFSNFPLYLHDTNFTISSDTTGGYGGYTYEWKLDDVTVGTASSITLNKPTGEYELKLIITDSIGNTDDYTSTITVVDNLPLSIETEALEDGLVSTAYEQELEIVGAVGGEEFSITRGALPAGFEIDSETGTISGSIATPGIYYFEIKVENSFTSATKLFTLFIAPASDDFAVFISLATYRQGSEYADIEPSHIAGDELLPVVLVYEASTTIVLTDNFDGTFELISGYTDRYFYSPVNKSRTATITATSGEDSDTATISVKATFPIQTQLGYEFDTPTLTELVKAKDNTPYFRRLPHFSATWKSNYSNRTKMDVAVVKAFEHFHDIDTEFYVVDPELELMILVRLTGSVNVRVDGANNFEMSAGFIAYKLSSLPISPTYS